MAAQATAYCGNGAIALLFFTWSGPGLDHTYVNDPELRTGVSAAAEACREAGVSLPTVLPAGG